MQGRLAVEFAMGVQTRSPSARLTSYLGDRQQQCSPNPSSATPVLVASVGGCFWRVVLLFAVGAAYGRDIQLDGLLFESLCDRSVLQQTSA